MKKLLIALSLILLLSQCRDSEVADENSDGRFNKEVGDEISLETAQRWIQNRKNTNAREEQFSVSPASLESALNAVSDKLGVVLHHALDENGGHHVLLVPVKSDLMLWTNGEVLDASSGDFVNASSANAWAEAYKQANPNGVWSHFFGIMIFEEILSKEGLSQVELVQAQNDNLLPQILLFVWSGDGDISNGRVQGEDLTVYDKSTLCPPVCPGAE